VSELKAIVYVSWGLWVADCPRPDCLGAEHFGHAPHTGYVGGLTRAGFCCAGCGLVCPCEWPANEDDIVRLLSQRPFPNTRNWKPGELVENLLAENIEHQLIDPRDLVAGELMRNGRLSTRVRQLIGSPGLAAIGG
jgi:hypothetical protein